MDGQGNLESTLLVREKSGNLKINGYGRQSSENISEKASLIFSAKNISVFGYKVVIHLTR